MREPLPYAAVLLACVAAFHVPDAHGFLPRMPGPGVAVTCRHHARSLASGPLFSTAEDDPTEKALDAMTAFTNRYTKITGTYLCAEASVTAVVVKGLAEHKVSLGAPLCPCRYYEDKEAEAKAGYWNCPCVPMRERHECHCMLFLTEDNDFAGKEQVIDAQEVRRLSGTM
eukprot:CAMPEP_0118961604 /NCGR_PEP_ID=MMETSP1173-20130426/232_1 /TAXON_ID=1034831 /ORGANISM="Rhizochromulina marina cf, Strain CCMP1243" /LENGTH=169 /DNA_ID=CAMNT_0006909785 /DNA_START=49 /DNA_END=558 /DNA_ORIENTATION=-